VRPKAEASERVSFDEADVERNEGSRLSDVVGVRTTTAEVKMVPSECVWTSVVAGAP
jgi:hypothetical protein